ncbi:protein DETOXIFICATION 55-like [Aristolochia californica]|uniref:protein DETOXIFICATION 55-like n=1 Tax=Aristolochia californica TaxID=171875 RepID=UPI0035DFE3F0
MFAGDQVEKYPTMAEIMEELKRMMDIGLPIAAMNLVGYLRSIVSVACMGRLGRLELAGGALAIGFTNITGYSVLSGLALGMDPLCSQAFGSRNLSLVTLTLQRTILMLLCASIPIALLWLNLEPIMLSLHQNADVTRAASLYCRFALPDLIANSFLHPIRIYLRNEGSVKPLMWCTSLSVVFHVPLTSLLAHDLHMGVQGVAAANFCTNFITLFFLLCYMLEIRASTSTTHGPLSTPLPVPVHPPLPLTTTRDEWSKLLRLALPSCLGVCLEWWWYEFMTVAAGYLAEPHVTLATSAIVIQTTSLMYTLPVALSSAVSTRVGLELGAGRPERARLTTVVSMAAAMSVSVIGVLWTTLGRGAWSRIFTNDEETIKLTVSVLPIIGLCELANCPQTAGCGVLRGCARPSVGATVNLYSFYLVGAPVAIVSAFFFETGFMGLCYGLLAAQITCALSIASVVYRTDWERESLKSKDLAGIGGCAHEIQTSKAGEDVEFLKQLPRET